MGYCQRILKLVFCIWIGLFYLRRFFYIASNLHIHKLHSPNGRQNQHFLSRVKGKDYPYLGLTYTANGIEYAIPFSGSDTIKAGQTVTIYYNPSNPKSYYILEDKSNAKIVGIAFIIGGIVFTVIGYLVGANVLQAHYRL